ncbi:MAG: hypothetical protein WBA13_05490 [Microcoleaceae cyanobacterium]
MQSKISSYTQPNSNHLDIQRSLIEPIKKVVPITPQRFRIEDQIEQPTFYLLEAQAGQTLNLLGESGTITAEIFSPLGQRLCRFKIHPDQPQQKYSSLSESGLYRILVDPGQISTAFTIKINLFNG